MFSTITIDLESWVERKYSFWRRLWEDLEIGYLDEDLLPLLLLLNIDRHIYTMSSCSGRIVVSDSSFPWSREETSIIFKKHEPISFEEFKNILSRKIVRRMWVNVTGPIIHLSTDSIEYALEILRLARNAGFKHSGIMSINRSKGVLLELVTGVYMSQLVKIIDGLVIDINRIEALVNTMNNVLLQGKSFLDRLYREFSNRGFERDEYIIRDLEGRGLSVDELLRGSPYKSS